MLAQRVKPALGASTDSEALSLSCDSDQLPDSGCAERWQAVAQELGFLPPVWETWVEFMVLVWAWTSPIGSKHLQSESGGDISLPFPPTHF